MLLRTRVLFFGTVKGGVLRLLASSCPSTERTTEGGHRILDGW